ALDEPREHATHGLDSQRERHDVEEQHVSASARQDASLDAGAERHHLVRVDVDEGWTAEDLLDLAADERRARRATHGNDLFDLAHVAAGVFERTTARPDRPCDDVADQALEVLASNGGPGLAPDLGQVEDHLGPQLRGELLLRPFGGGTRSRAHGWPARELRGQLGEDHLGQSRVEVVAAETGVAVGGENLEDAAAEFE